MLLWKMNSFYYYFQEDLRRALRRVEKFEVYFTKNEFFHIYSRQKTSWKRSRNSILEP